MYSELKPVLWRWLRLRSLCSTPDGCHHCSTWPLREQHPVKLHRFSLTSKEVANKKIAASSKGMTLHGNLVPLEKMTTINNEGMIQSLWRQAFLETSVIF